MGGGRRRPEDSCECRQTTLGNEVGRLGDGGNLLPQALPCEQILPEAGGAAVGADFLAAVNGHGAAAADQSVLDRDAAVAVVAVSVPALADVEHDTEGLGDVRDDAAVGADLGPHLLEVEIIRRETVDVDSAFGEELLQTGVGRHALAVVRLARLYREEALRLEIGANAGGDKGLEERKRRLDADVIDGDADVQGAPGGDHDPVDVEDSARTVSRGGIFVQIPVDEAEVDGRGDEIGVDARVLLVGLGRGLDVGKEQVTLVDPLEQPGLLAVGDAGREDLGERAEEAVERLAVVLQRLLDSPLEALLLHGVGTEDVTDADAEAEFLESLVVLLQQDQHREPRELARIVGEGAEVQGEDQQAGDLHQRIVLVGVPKVLDGFDVAVAGVVAELLAAEVEADEREGPQAEELADLCETESSHGVLLGRKTRLLRIDTRAEVGTRSLGTRPRWTTTDLHIVVEAGPKKIMLILLGPTSQNSVLI